MSRYHILHRLRHDGVLHEVGCDPVELTDAVAAPLLTVGAIEIVEAQPAAAATHTQPSDDDRTDGLSLEDAGAGAPAPASSLPSTTDVQQPSANASPSGEAAAADSQGAVTEGKPGKKAKAKG